MSLFFAAIVPIVRDFQSISENHANGQPTFSIITFSSKRFCVVGVGVRFAYVQFPSATKKSQSLVHWAVVCVFLRTDLVLTQKSIDQIPDAATLFSCMAGCIHSSSRPTFLNKAPAVYTSTWLHYFILYIYFSIFDGDTRCAGQITFFRVPPSFRTMIILSDSRVRRGIYHRRCA